MTLKETENKVVHIMLDVRIPVYDTDLRKRMEELDKETPGEYDAPMEDAIEFIKTHELDRFKEYILDCMDISIEDDLVD